MITRVEVSPTFAQLRRASKMYAFARGVLLRRPLCSSPFPAPTMLLLRPPAPAHVARARPFSKTVSLLRTVKKAPKPPKPAAAHHAKPSKPAPPTPTATSTAAAPRAHATRPDFLPFEAQLRQKAEPTLLYEAPSHAGYTMACYSAAAFFFGYAGWNFFASCVSPPPGLAVWVPWAFAVVCFFMSAIGGYLVLSPASLIRRITVHPSRATVPRISVVSSGVKQRMPAAAAQSDPLTVVIELSRMVPFKRPRTLQALPEELSLNYKLYHPTTAASADRRLSAAEKVELLRQSPLPPAQSVLEVLARPFRLMSRGFMTLVYQTQRAWTRESFLKLKVADQSTYKLDISGGWALDDGRALDRLVRTTPRS